MVYIRKFSELPFMVDVSSRDFESKSYYTVEKVVEEQMFSVVSLKEGKRYVNFLSTGLPIEEEGEYTFAGEGADTKDYSSTAKYIFNKEGFTKGRMLILPNVDEHSDYFIKCLCSKNFGYDQQFPRRIAYKIIKKKTQQELFADVYSVEDFYESLDPMSHPDVHGLPDVQEDDFEELMKALAKLESFLYGEQYKGQDLSSSSFTAEDMELFSLLPGDDEPIKNAAEYLELDDIYTGNIYGVTDKLLKVYYNNFKKAGFFMFKEIPSVLSFAVVRFYPGIAKSLGNYVKTLKPEFNDMIPLLISAGNIILQHGLSKLFKDILTHVKRVDKFKSYVRQSILPNIGKEWKMDKACNIFEPLDDQALNELAEYYQISPSIPRERKCIELYLVIKRLRIDTSICNNLETSISGDVVGEVDPRLLYTFEENGKTYCENIEEFHEYLKNSTKNPFTNVELTKEVIKEVKTKYRNLKNIKRTGDNILDRLKPKGKSQIWADLVSSMYYPPGIEKYNDASLKQINLLRIYVGLDRVETKEMNDDSELFKELIDKQDSYKEYILTAVLSEDTAEMEEYLDY